MSEIKIDQYTTLKIENGEYGVKLIEGWIVREGDFKPNFCKREFKKGGGEKTAPVSVKLGTPESAVSVALAILSEFNYQPEKRDDDSAPF